MAAAELFWMKGGPVLDENGFSIEQALDEQGVLAIGPPDSQVSQTILVAKGVKPEISSPFGSTWVKISGSCARNWKRTSG